MRQDIDYSYLHLATKVRITPYTKDSRKEEIVRLKCKLKTITTAFDRLKILLNKQAKELELFLTDTTNEIRTDDDKGKN